MPKEGKNKKVIVAMSGGLDSSVAAALLKRAGFNVVGVFMRLWSPVQSRQNETRARKVAKILKIPFYVFNFEKEFKKRIVDKFLAGYKKGITPNPCVVCNKEMKFGLLLEKALALDADYVATGHYARTNLYTKNSMIVENVGTVKLLRAKDNNKDQSYFLWMLNQGQLKRVLFPIGSYTRLEVESLAKKFKLPVLKARKSVEICFIPTKIEDFLKKYLKEKEGKIIDTQGKFLGRHKGLSFYTIGQRKGIGLAGGPYWVVDKNIARSVLVVTKKERDLYSKELLAKNVSWVSGKFSKLPLKVKAKIRYRHRPASAVITKNPKPKIYNLKFKKSQRAVTPGQSAVFYRDEELLGGGVLPG